MIGSDLKIFVESLIDDSIEEDLFYSLLNSAKDKLEDEREWEILKDWDSNLIWTPGDNYLTAKSMPATFRSMYGDGVIYLGEDSRYYSVPYKDIYRYRSATNRYSIDYLNNKLHIIGAESAAATIHIPFLVTTADITSTTEWAFPSRYHKILGYRVAAYHTGGVDTDDIYARMSPVHRAAAMELEDGLRRWNTRMALMAMNNRAQSNLSNEGSSSDGRLSADDL